MPTDIGKASPGYRQAASTNEREKRKNLAPFQSGNRVMTIGIIVVILVLAFRITVVLRWPASELQSNFVIQSVISNLGIQDLNLSLQQPPQTRVSGGEIDLIFKTKPTVRETFIGKIRFVVNETEYIQNASLGWDSGRAFKTVIEPNKNIVQFGLVTLDNVCTRPDGPIVVVGRSDEEFVDEISKDPELEKQWQRTYNCTRPHDCMGSESITPDSIPEDARWVSGTTIHIIPYPTNALHNIGERLWPHMAGFVSPLNETVPHSIHHFLVHRLSAWLNEAASNMNSNTIMYLVRMLGELAPEADFLTMDGFHGNNNLVCYDRLVLACSTCDRVSDELGDDIATRAMLNYRNKVLQFFGVPEPAIPLPPRLLRLAVYGRRFDTKRETMLNKNEVVQHLRSYTNPPFAIIDIDELVASKRYNQSFPEMVSLMSQIDIYVMAHGASTYATFLLPLHAALIEIEGPCGATPWMNFTANALGLRHHKLNPWDVAPDIAVANLDAGNTTECIEGENSKTPDYNVDLQKLDAAISALASPVFGPEDRISPHWNYGRQSESPVLPKEPDG